jgi:hypothetical protein
MTSHKQNPLTDQNVLVFSDALTFVERVPSRSVALCYFDPPLSSYSDSPLFPHSDEGSDASGSRLRILRLGEILFQVKRTLTETGNIFVHSEPEMNGTIRLLLDQVFERNNFRQEIVVPGIGRGTLSRDHETVFHFSKGPQFFFDTQKRPLKQSEIGQFKSSDTNGPYRLVSLTSRVLRPSFSFEWQGFTPSPATSWLYSKDKLEQLLEQGRIVLGGMPRLKQYLSEIKTDVDVGTIWDDLTGSQTVTESLGFATQKLKSVVTRIVRMGSSEGDVVLDPFCGTGTTLVVAQENQRRWLGGDNNQKAIEISTDRLKNMCGLEQGRDYSFLGEECLQQCSAGFSAPHGRIVTGFDDFVLEPINRFVLGKPLEIEETREYKFKEVTSSRPSKSIGNTADEYAVAFLNSEGGRIFWGIRDSDRVVVGVKIDSQERNHLRQVVTDKLADIRPAIDPTAYRFVIHRVEGQATENDLVVVELVIPTVRVSQPYFTGGNEAFVRVEGVKRKLAGPELTDWIIRRLENR